MWVSFRESTTSKFYSIGERIADVYWGSNQIRPGENFPSNNPFGNSSPLHYKYSPALYGVHTYVNVGPILQINTHDRQRYYISISP